MNETIQEHYVGPVVQPKEHERTNRPPVGLKGGTGGRWVGRWGRWSFYIHRLYPNVHFPHSHQSNWGVDLVVRTTGQCTPAASALCPVVNPTTDQVDAVDGRLAGIS